MEPNRQGEASEPRRCHLACRAWSGLKQDKLSTWMAQENLPFLRLDKKHQAAWAFIDFSSKEQEDAFTAQLANVFFKGERIHVHPAHPRPFSSPSLLGAALSPGGPPHTSPLPTPVAGAPSVSDSPTSPASSRCREAEKRRGHDIADEGRKKTKRRRRGQAFAGSDAEARGPPQSSTPAPVAESGDARPSGSEPHACGWRPGSLKPPLPSLFEIQKKRNATKHSPGPLYGGGADDDGADGTDGVVHRTAPLMRFCYPDQLEMKRTYLRTSVRQLTKAVYTAALQMGLPGLSAQASGGAASAALDAEEDEALREEQSREAPKDEDETQTHAAATAQLDAQTRKDAKGAAGSDEGGQAEAKEEPLPWFHPQVARRWNGCEVLPTVPSPPSGRLGYRNKCEFTIGYTHEVADSYDEKMHQYIRLLHEKQNLTSLVPQLQLLDVDGDEPWCTVLQHEPRHCLVAVASRARPQGGGPRAPFLSAARGTAGARTREPDTSEGPHGADEGTRGEARPGGAGDRRSATAVVEPNARALETEREAKGRGGEESETPEVAPEGNKGEEAKRQVGRLLVSKEEHENYLEHRARVCVGFVKRVQDQQPLVAPASGSLLVSHAMQEICVELQAIIHRSPFPVYNRRTQKGVWRLLMVRSSEAYRELLVLVQIKSFSSPNNKHLRCGPACARDEPKGDTPGQGRGDSVDERRGSSLFSDPSRGESLKKETNGLPDSSGDAAERVETKENGERGEKATESKGRETEEDSCCRRACIKALIDGLANKQFDGYTVRSIFLEESDAASDCIDPSHPTEKIWGADFITQKVADLDFRVGPHSFFQTNSVTCALLYQTALNCLMPLPPHTPLVDVCSGTGTIALCAASALKRETAAKGEAKGDLKQSSGAPEEAKDASETRGAAVPRVVGVEMVEEAVRNAEQNAERNQLAQDVDFVCGKAEDVLPRLLQERYRGCTDLAAIVDPPRAGLHSRVLEAILDFQPIKRLVYISCNPASMVANCVKLCTPSPSNRDPFVPVQAVPVDMFPHTLHCEAVLLLSRQSDLENCKRAVAQKARDLSAPEEAAGADRGRPERQGDQAAEREPARSSGASGESGARTRRRSRTGAEREALFQLASEGPREAEGETGARGQRGRRARGGGRGRLQAKASSPEKDTPGRSERGLGAEGTSLAAISSEASNPLMQS
ncbi:hypothetical protein NCLIV_066290 [Neospora caninum Liverpool]|uniref:tRNA (Uracil-5-)-methyltransferase homolog A n=1 Tax=Neospora caninum (strain Liverpool) TaxID=572307 RepID=F0VR56_NEOCL|nr:hypothetical protein NCLIV_066290 [Neospora caninum Liverpool]CBZ56204.1 hypothetical protein NCLIV_066290 [Neospora caninum Liverpool]CEL70966.1 TPA: tRNA (uracil-5-)-methyltransferase homolog A [Neospora caninum Liverpool]|eukprot:XP_003886229.1 hypothetical protein NCLIV_066290 [Neospora caninum Liverpool]